MVTAHDHPTKLRCEFPCNDLDVFSGTPKFRQKQFLLDFCPGPRLAPEFVFAHILGEAFLSHPFFLCGPPLASERPLFHASFLPSGIGLLDRISCCTQQKRRLYTTLWRFAPLCCPSLSVLCPTLSIVEEPLAQHHSCACANCCLESHSSCNFGLGRNHFFFTALLF